MVSKRNFAALLQTTTQSSDRLRKVPTRSTPTCSQTETSSLSAPNVSVAIVFFQSSFIGIKPSGVHDTSFQSNMKCYVNIRKELYANVVLSSDTTMFQRIVEPMTKELTVFASPTMMIMLVAPPERERALGMNWRISLVPLSTFLQMWISRASTMDLARPSPIGSAELTFLTCCFPNKILYGDWFSL